MGGGVVQVCVGSTTHVPSNRSEILVSIMPVLLNWVRLFVHDA